MVAHSLVFVPVPCQRSQLFQMGTLLAGNYAGNRCKIFFSDLSRQIISKILTVCNIANHNQVGKG